ncbi:MAG: hypothetical protein ACFFKA_00115 [Candidatus Thorarchaeota archaeon]
MEYVEYTDTRCEAVFTLPLFDNTTSADDLLITYAEVVNDAIFCALGNLSENPEWDVVPCLLTEDGVFDIKRDSCQEQLDKCLAYYIENENYENASLLSSFKEKLQ